MLGYGPKGLPGMHLREIFFPGIKSTASAWPPASGENSSTSAVQAPGRRMLFRCPGSDARRPGRFANRRHVHGHHGPKKAESELRAGSLRALARILISCSCSTQEAGSSINRDPKYPSLWAGPSTSYSPERPPKHLGHPSGRTGSQPPRGGRDLARRAERVRNRPSLSRATARVLRPGLTRDITKP